MLVELKMANSPAYSFSSDIIHNGTEYTQVEDVVLDDPGWDDHLGPTDSRLQAIYQQRLRDPDLKKEYLKKMDVLTSSRTLYIELEWYESEPTEENVFAIVDLNVQYEDLNINIDLHDPAAIQYWTVRKGFEPTSEPIQSQCQKKIHVTKSPGKISTMSTSPKNPKCSRKSKDAKHASVSRGKPPKKKSRLA